MVGVNLIAPGLQIGGNWSSEGVLETSKISRRINPWKPDQEKPQNGFRVYGLRYKNECCARAAVTISIASAMQYSYPLQLSGLFIGSWSPTIFHWLFWIQYQEFPSTCAACLKVEFEFEWRATYFAPFRPKHTLATPGCQNEFDPQLSSVEFLHSNLHTTFENAPTTCRS